jgi:ABC-type amino acid transport substrate-binding protein
MMSRRDWRIGTGKWSLVGCLLLLITLGTASGADLPEIKKRGVLRHLGVPYAEFIVGAGTGLDSELIKLFAAHLGVRYEYVETSWKAVIGDLTGKRVRPEGTDIEVLGDVPVRGDIIANGLTILPWREKVLDFSIPTFPSGVWLITRADSSLTPISPTGKIQSDIKAVKSLLQNRSVLAMENSCIDPNLHGIYSTGAKVILFDRQLNELAPAIINRDADASLLDVPDALIALIKWPGKIKIIGPISQMQEMGCGFAKDSPLLRQEFNRFFDKCKKDGSYRKLVQKHYPSVISYFPEFFEKYEIR